MVKKNKCYQKPLKRLFTPENNNVMELFFSLINDIIYQARSFKTNTGLMNFSCNMFAYFNKRSFITGLTKGFSPTLCSKFKDSTIT